MQRPARKANVRWFSTRQKPKGRRRRPSPRQLVLLRLNDLATLFRARYGQSGLPDDDSGRDDIEPVLHHLAARPQPTRQCEQWLDLWAPWLSRAESKELIAKALLHQRAWSADQLAWRYRITLEERTMLGLTTIGAIDYGKAARTKRRRERDRQRKQAERRAKGIKTRAEYLATTKTTSKPWEAEGISRATWYRRQRETGVDDETGPATA